MDCAYCYRAGQHHAMCCTLSALAKPVVKPVCAECKGTGTVMVTTGGDGDRYGSRTDSQSCHVCQPIRLAVEYALAVFGAEPTAQLAAVLTVPVAPTPPAPEAPTLASDEDLGRLGLDTHEQWWLDRHGIAIDGWESTTKAGRLAITSAASAVATRVRAESRAEIERLLLANAELGAEREGHDAETSVLTRERDAYKRTRDATAAQLAECVKDRDHACDWNEIHRDAVDRLTRERNEWCTSTVAAQDDVERRTEQRDEWERLANTYASDRNAIASELAECVKERDAARGWLVVADTALLASERARDAAKRWASWWKRCASYNSRWGEDVSRELESCERDLITARAEGDALAERVERAHDSLARNRSLWGSSSGALSVIRAIEHALDDKNGAAK